MSSDSRRRTKRTLSRPPTHPEADPHSDAWGRSWLVLALGVSAFGAWHHNIQEGVATFAPETLAALLPATGLALWWSLRPGRFLWWTTLIWVGPLNLIIGAVLSVLPLPIWPFVPEQTSSHFTAHLAYLLAQLPALYALWSTRPEAH